MSPNNDGNGAGSERERQIAERAYYRWQARGGEHGGDLQDWLEAESEFTQPAEPQRETATPGATTAQTRPASSPATSRP